MVARLVTDLGSDSFAVREKAAAELEKLGEGAGPGLRKALASEPTAEVRRRVEGLLDRQQWPASAPEAVRGLRAVEALERIGTPEAREALKGLAGGIPEAVLTRAAQAALERLGER
jgi:HEAT repeat protein